MRTPQPGKAEIRAILAKCKGGLVAVGAFSAIINILVLAGPLYMMLVYDRALGSGNISTLIGLSVLLGGLFLAMGFLTIVRSRLLVRMANRLGNNLQDRAFEVQMRHAAATRTSPEDGATRDLNTVRDFLGSPTPATLMDAPWMPFFILIAYILHPYLGYIAAGGAAVLLVLGILNDVTTRRRFHDAAGLNAQSGKMLSDAARNSEIVAAMRMTPTLNANWSRIQNAAQNHQSRANDTAATYSSLTRTFRMMLQSTVLGVGAYLAIVGDLSAGAIIAASVIVARGLAPAEQAIGSWRHCVAATAAYRRLIATLQAYPIIEEPMTLPKPKGAIDVKHLFAAAPGERDPMIRDVSFRLDAGETLAIIGPSGSGKSTLVRAVIGAWAPLRGEVRLDGTEMHHWSANQLNTDLGYLPQDVELFDGTIRDNIGRFSQDIDDVEIVRAARMSGAHETILQADTGYATKLGQGGGRLSGGERQRIGLARAVYGNPALVVLDEPNASLDSAGETALAGAIEALQEAGRTVIIISHKPSAIKLAHKVLVLKDGRVDAFGPKEAVLNVGAGGMRVVSQNGVLPLKQRKA